MARRDGLIFINWLSRTLEVRLKEHMPTIMDHAELIERLLALGKFTLERSDELLDDEIDAVVMLFKVANSINTDKNRENRERNIDLLANLVDQQEQVFKGFFGYGNEASEPSKEEGPKEETAEETSLESSITKDELMKKINALRFDISYCTAQFMLSSKEVEKIPFNDDFRSTYRAVIDFTTNMLQNIIKEASDDSISREETMKKTHNVAYLIGLLTASLETGEPGKSWALKIKMQDTLKELEQMYTVADKKVI